MKTPNRTEITQLNTSYFNRAFRAEVQEVVQLGIKPIQWKMNRNVILDDELFY